MLYTVYQYLLPEIYKKRGVIMFDIFITDPAGSIMGLAIWSFMISFYLPNVAESKDPIDSAFKWCFYTWIIIGLPIAVFTTPESFLRYSDSLVFFANTIATLGVIIGFLGRKLDFKKRYAKYRVEHQMKKEKNNVIETTENICGKMQLPTTAKAELGKALKEWKIVNKEIVPIKKLLAEYQEALAEVHGLHKEALVLFNSVSNEDDLKELKASYAHTAEDIAGQHDELKKLVDEYQQQVHDKNARIGELLKLFEKAKKDAESYKKYDAFTTEALVVQKKLKEKLLKAKKTK
jgi:hypothetical protein